MWPQAKSALGITAIGLWGGSLALVTAPDLIGESEMGGLVRALAVTATVAWMCLAHSHPAPAGGRDADYDEVIYRLGHQAGRTGRPATRAVTRAVPRPRRGLLAAGIAGTIGLGLGAYVATRAESAPTPQPPVAQQPAAQGTGKVADVITAASVPVRERTPKQKEAAAGQREAPERTDEPREMSPDRSDTTSAAGQAPVIRERECLLNNERLRLRVGRVAC